jgi:hypothetical protein
MVQHPGRDVHQQHPGKDRERRAGHGEAKGMAHGARVLPAMAPGAHPDRVAPDHPCPDDAAPMSDMAHGSAPLRATPTPSQRAQAYRAPNGWIIFAAVTLFMSGGLSILFGLAALLNGDVVKVGTDDGPVILDFTTWGWVALVAGGVMMLTGLGIGLGAGVARWTAIGFVVVHAALMFGLVSAFPVLAIMIIALDVVILYQLAVHWDG